MATKQITLDFSEEQYNYIMLVCRRKMVSLKDYILDNFEWDEVPQCIEEDIEPCKEICEDCEFASRGTRSGCPDFTLDKK